MKFYLFTLGFLSLSPLASALVKSADCQLQAGQTTDKVARVEYVRSTVLKSVTLAPHWNAFHEEITYVDSCLKFGANYLCVNPVKDYELEAQLRDGFLIVTIEDAKTNIYDCR